MIFGMFLKKKVVSDWRGFSCGEFLVRRTPGAKAPFSSVVQRGPSLKAWLTQKQGQQQQAAAKATVGQSNGGGKSKASDKSNGGGKSSGGDSVASSFGDAEEDDFCHLRA
ncbi:MAG: hypothetical protein WDN23_00655 [Edaphobacter sp.]